MSQVLFRRAAVRDLPALRDLVEGTYRGERARAGWTHEADLLSGERTSDVELAAVLANPAQAMLVAEQDGAVIGTVTITRAAPGKAYLGMLSVAPQRQAGGLGRALIAAAEGEAVRCFGSNVMEMTVIDRRAELIAWYERRGYRRTGETRPFPYVPAAPADFAMVVLERALT
ncbi:GNAT family N-acetyltransferase [Novosphingobium flavum]|uniref:GNAT family N-acetyltransferase n=1 Tax=Novosphingobium flavum TaxID=1778672 RepID=A0A7X1FUT7_9SPHN|nr:GNAT family N-acetyltransferase [Novosphingobium flavum]MBC2667388.1 GNAT family N-acetyltransferase [Novosphingobium flavum]